MLILIFLAFSVFFGILFNLKLRKNQTYLKQLDRYESVNFSNLYVDLETQAAILKRVFSAEINVEKNLRMLIVLSVIFFVAAFVQLIVLFLGK